MFFIGLIFIIAALLILAVVAWMYGTIYSYFQERKFDREQQARIDEQNAIERELDQKRELLAVAQETAELTRNQLTDEQHYIDGLKKETERIERNLQRLEEQQIPTREQLDTWLFLLKADNRLTNKQANEIMRLYDVKQLYPKVKGEF